MAAAEDSKLKNVVVSEGSSGSSGPEQEKITGIDEGSGSSTEPEHEKETGIDVGIPLDKLSLGPKKKLLILPLEGFILHRAHRRSPSTLTKECTDSGFKCLENKKSSLFLKELLYIWGKKYKSLPWGDEEYDASNTLLIANPAEALLNPPNTGIFPKEYDPENKDDDLLGQDGELRVFLDGFIEAKDVPTYMKDHPYGEPAITPLHSDWEYYSKIIRSFDKKEDDTTSDSSELPEPLEPSCSSSITALQEVVQPVHRNRRMPEKYNDCILRKP